MKDLDMLKRVAARTLDRLSEFPEQDFSMFGRPEYRWGNWDWGAGVALYGLFRANERLSDARIVDKMKCWMDERLEKPERKICVNTTAPLIAALSLCADNPDPKYENLFRKYDRYYLEEIERTSGGAFIHASVRGDYPAQIWADTLFMAAIYLSKRARAAKDGEIAGLAVRQLAVHLSALRDDRSGLFFHGWDDNRKIHIGALWGRGNAWIAASAVDILENIPGDTADTREIRKILEAFFAALGKAQDAEGYWRTVLNEPRSYRETTATAGIAYGILKGIRLGLVDPKHGAMARNAVRAVAGEIDSRGVMLMASAGTSVMEDAEAYAKVPYEETPYSQGLALLALGEAFNFNMEMEDG